MTRTADVLLQEDSGLRMNLTCVQRASAFELGVELGRAEATEEEEEEAAACSVRARPDTAHRAPSAGAAKGATGGQGVADSAEIAKGSIGKGSAEERLPRG
eukprot:167004-Prorocentrum_minimum.AAC.1